MSVDPAAILESVPKDFTPGPWRTDPADRFVVTADSGPIVDAGGGELPEVRVRSDVVCYANAALIARAPDLVEALRVALKQAAKLVQHLARDLRALLDALAASEADRERMLRLIACETEVVAAYRRDEASNERLMYDAVGRAERAEARVAELEAIAFPASARASPAAPPVPTTDRRARATLAEHDGQRCGAVGSRKRGDKISKPNTLPGAVFGFADEREAEDLREAEERGRRAGVVEERARVVGRLRNGAEAQLRYGLLDIGDELATCADLFESGAHVAKEEG
jgi:hypothetical protein